MSTFNQPIPGATTVIAELELRNNADLPVVDSNRVRGGAHAVPDLATRDAIPTPLRKADVTRCYVTATNTTYVLRGGIANTNWQPEPGAAVTGLGIGQFMAEVAAVVGTALNVAFPTNLFTSPAGLPISLMSVQGVPAGLTFDPTTKAIIGTPTEVGRFVVLINAQDNATGKLQYVLPIRVSAAPVVISTTNAGTLSIDLVFDYRLANDFAPRLQLVGRTDHPANNQSIRPVAVAGDMPRYIGTPAPADCWAVAALGQMTVAGSGNQAGYQHFMVNLAAERAAGRTGTLTYAVYAQTIKHDTSAFWGFYVKTTLNYGTITAAPVSGNCDFVPTGGVVPNGIQQFYDANDNRFQVSLDHEQLVGYVNVNLATDQVSFTRYVAPSLLPSALVITGRTPNGTAWPVAPNGDYPVTLGQHLTLVADSHPAGTSLHWFSHNPQTGALTDLGVSDTLDVLPSASFRQFYAELSDGTHTVQSNLLNCVVTSQATPNPPVVTAQGLVLGTNGTYAVTSGQKVTLGVDAAAGGSIPSGLTLHWYERNSTTGTLSPRGSTVTLDVWPSTTGQQFVATLVDGNGSESSISNTITFTVTAPPNAVTYFPVGLGITVQEPTPTVTTTYFPVGQPITLGDTLPA